jgi:hypothetical protein
MRYYCPRPGITVEEAVGRAIALAEGLSELIELEYEGRRVIVCPTHIGQVCRTLTMTEPFLPLAA